MNYLMLLPIEGELFSAAEIKMILRQIPGITEIREDIPCLSPVEASFENRSGTSQIALALDCESISFSWHSDAAMDAVLLVAGRLGQKLRLIDSYYSFDLYLAEERTRAALKESIALAST